MIASEEKGLAMFKKIVLAVDGSQESAEAVGLAEAVAGQFDSEVLVLSVRENVYSGAATWSPDWTVEMEHFNREVASRIGTSNIDVRSEVVDAPKGDAGKAIADTAEKETADLIIMGSRGRSRITGALLGSVAGSVVHNARCPVLIAR
jgi:nucleotide-binding universal stress UspA family protein